MFQIVISRHSKTRSKWKKTVFYINPNCTQLQYINICKSNFFVMEPFFLTKSQKFLSPFFWPFFYKYTDNVIIWKNEHKKQWGGFYVISRSQHKPPSLFGAIFLQNYLDGVLEKKVWKKRVENFCYFVKKLYQKKGITSAEWFCKELTCQIYLINWSYKEAEFAKKK